MPDVAEVLLASQSPRRKQLLEACGVRVTVAPAHIDEAPQGGEAATELVVRLARGKVAAVSAHAGSRPILHPILGADTEVVLDGRPLSKPRDAEDAVRMLRALAGRSHDVMTGYCARGAGGEAAGVVVTRVTFRPLADDEIRRYVDSGEPLDKAGGYGIQGLGGALVDAVAGSYTNVVGLPLREVLDALRRVARGGQGG